MNEQSNDEYKELKLFNRTEAANALSIGKDALSLLINEGKIGVIQIGERWMISYREIARYIEENTIRADQVSSGKADLESFRNSCLDKSIVDSTLLLTKIMEKRDGKYIS
jgi:excisionase family DNA binding protein